MGVQFHIRQVVLQFQMGPSSTPSSSATAVGATAMGATAVGATAVGATAMGATAVGATHHASRPGVREDDIGAYLGVGGMKPDDVARVGLRGEPHVTHPRISCSVLQRWAWVWRVSGGHGFGG